MLNICSVPRQGIIALHLFREIYKYLPLFGQTEVNET